MLMSTATPSRPATSFRDLEIPSLNAGDHLDQKTFHRRYEAMPRSFRAELVKGVVIVPSPLGCPHGEFHGRILAWLGWYSMSTPGTTFFDNTTTIIDKSNEFQPDAQLVILPEYGGRGVQLGKYVQGAPQLVVEVAASSAAYDLFEKYDVYQQAGVQEYLVVLAEEAEVRWFARTQGKYEPLQADAAGVIRSVMFPGLWLDTAALFAEQPANLLTTLQAGLADAGHAAFVRQLAVQRQSSEAPPV
jgi:Uma2 family endonuclease